MVFAHTAGDVVQQSGFTSARRGDDQAALAFADRAKQVDHAGGHAAILGLQLDLVFRSDGQELSELETLHALFDRFAVNRLDEFHLRIGETPIVLRRGNNVRALLELETADEFARHKRIRRAGFTVALWIEQLSCFIVQGLQDAFNKDKVATFFLEG